MRDGIRRSLVDRAMAFFGQAPPLLYVFLYISVLLIFPLLYGSLHGDTFFSSTAQYEQQTLFQKAAVIEELDADLNVGRPEE